VERSWERELEEDHTAKLEDMQTIKARVEHQRTARPESDPHTVQRSKPEQDWRVDAPGAGRRADGGGMKGIVANAVIRKSRKRGSVNFATKYVGQAEADVIEDDNDVFGASLGK
jgi:hypothetical protein